MSRNDRSNGRHRSSIRFGILIALIAVGCLVGVGMATSQDAAAGTSSPLESGLSTADSISEQDGETVYTASADGTVRASAPNGTELWEFDSPSNTVEAVTASPDGEFVFAGGDNASVHKVDADSGSHLEMFSHSSYDVLDLATGPDGDRLYAAYESYGPLTAIDVESGTVVWSDDHGDDITAVAAAPDGSTVYSGDEYGQLRAHDAADGAVNWEASADGIRTEIAVGPGGESVYAASSDGTVQAVDTATGDVAWTEPMDANVGDVLVSSDGGTVYTGSGQSISALDAESGSVDWTSDVGQSVTQLEMDRADGSLIAGLATGEYRVVDPEDGDASRTHGLHDGEITDIAFLGGDNTGLDAELAVAPEVPTVGESVSFDASESNGSVVEYQWNFGDGTSRQTTDPTVTHVYDAAGTYDAAVTVVGENGATNSTTVTVPVEEAPEAEFSVELGEVTETVETGQTVTANATIENVGTETGTDAVTLAIGGTVVDETDVEELAPGATENVSLTWDTDTDDAGSHGLAVSTSDDEATTTVTVDRPPTFSVTVLETNSPIEAGDTLLVNASIENAGTVAGEQTVALTVSGREVDNRTIALDGGAETTTSFEWTGDEVGNLTAAVASENDTASVPITVEKPPTFPVILEETTAPVEVGSDLNATVTVANDGNASANTTVEVQLGGEVRANRTVDLGPGENRTLTLPIETDGLDAGNRILVVSTADDSAGTMVELEEESGGGGGLPPAPSPPGDDPAVLIDELSVPDGVDAGATFELDVTVQNDGDESTLGSISVLVDGDEVATETVSVDAGDTTTVTATATAPETAEGETLQVTVETDDDAASASVPVRESGPDVVLADAAMPSTAAPGDNVTATVTVTNDGDAVTTESISYEIDGTTVASEEVTLEPGTSETRELEGTVPADVDEPDVQQTVAVAEEEVTDTLVIEDSSDDSIPGFGFLATVLGFALGAARLRR